MKLPTDQIPYGFFYGKFEDFIFETIVWFIIIRYPHFLDAGNAPEKLIVEVKLLSKNWKPFLDTLYAQNNFYYLFDYYSMQLFY